ncbi:uncharacterized protein LOC118219946 isoform X2 [Anguilla anguilla]|uniref:uncharacterized protein LOC118219946 isoform X2 n=1 Tax=Anguilla anguilla TaxID=7936 RepID=UPI0015B33CEA|nr:uncharacterized protein LOC118219946 isoform X2 [Anguilla anguilla]
MMQAGICLRQDTETTLPEFTEEHRIRQKEEELSGLESVHMVESETMCAAPGLDTLEPECVTAHSGVTLLPSHHPFSRSCCLDWQGVTVTVQCTAPVRPSGHTVSTGCHSRISCSHREPCPRWAISLVQLYDILAYMCIVHMINLPVADDHPKGKHDGCVQFGQKNTVGMHATAGCFELCKIDFRRALWPRDQGLPFPAKPADSSGYSRYCSLVSPWCQKSNFPIELHSKL